MTCKRRMCFHSAFAGLWLTGEKRKRTKGRSEERGGKLKVFCSHKVTQVFLITSSFHLLLSHQHKCVKTQGSKKLGVESEQRKMRWRKC